MRGLVGELQYPLNEEFWKDWKSTEERNDQRTRVKQFQKEVMSF